MELSEIVGPAAQAIVEHQRDHRERGVAAVNRRGLENLAHEPPRRREARILYEWVLSDKLVVVEAVRLCGENWPVCESRIDGDDAQARDEGVAMICRRLFWLGFGHDSPDPGGLQCDAFR